MHNAVPGFTKNGVCGRVALGAANTNSDGTGNLTTPTMYNLVAADATNGTYIDFIRTMPVASAASTATTATVIRFYISSISSGATTNADTFCIGEVAVPAITADSPTVANNPIDFVCQFRLPAGTYLHCSTHAVAAANTKWEVTAWGGDF